MSWLVWQQSQAGLRPEELQMLGLLAQLWPVREPDRREQDQLGERLLPFLCI